MKQNIYESLYGEIVQEDGKSMVAGAMLGLNSLFGSPADAVESPHKAIATAQTTNQAHDEQNINIIARTIYREGLGESPIGMKAIASTIYNRGGGDVSRMVAVIQRPKIFSCWNKMTPSDWKNFKIKEYSGTPWDTAKALATEIVNGKFTPLLSSTHYYNPKKANPSWAYYADGRHRPYAKIGNHRFMKDIA